MWFLAFGLCTARRDAIECDSMRNEERQIGASNRHICRHYHLSVLDLRISIHSR